MAYPLDKQIKNPGLYPASVVITIKKQWWIERAARIQSNRR